MRLTNYLRHLAVVGLLLRAAASAAQSPDHPLEITGFFGIQAGDTIQSAPGRLEVDAAPSYGVMVDVRVRPDATIQILYDRQDTALDFRSSDPLFPREVTADLAIEYYHLGGTVEFKKDRFRPYLALTVGATRFDPQVRDVGDEWRFSVSVGLGFKAYMTPRVGLRVDGRVWPTFIQTSGGLFCGGGGGGCLVSVEADFFTQVNATAGLFVTF
jgi:hypothetical protein